MCGFNFGLIEAAHVYPVSAPGSTDDSWNGLALCRNHHAAFDRHLIWVNPSTFQITLANALKSNSHLADSCDAFIKTTADALSVPASVASRPRPEMFEKRYDHFQGKYDWAN
jgi:hypothetical protein